MDRSIADVSVLYLVICSVTPSEEVAFVMVSTNSLTGGMVVEKKKENDSR